MAQQLLTVLEPDFYKDFHCVAAACRNNCCVHQWAIPADKAIYKKWRQLKEPAWFAQNLSAYVKRNKDSKHDKHYAFLVRNQQGCVLQTAQGLCRMHAQLGEEYLCSTCRTYPRRLLLTVQGVGNRMVMERGICCSCEEVVRMLLCKPEPIQFVSSTVEAPSELTSPYYRDVAQMLVVTGNRPILHHYHLVRSICIAVLQSREYSFEQRLKLFCILAQKLDTAEQEQQVDALPQLLEQYVAAVEQRLYDALLAGTAKTDLAKVFAAHGTFGAFSWTGDTAFIERCNTGLEVDYEERSRQYSAFMADKEHLLEHIFVNELFQRVIPFESKFSIWKNAQYLVSVYITLRFVMGIWLAGSKDMPTQTDLIDFIAFFGKTVLHSNGSLVTNLKLLEVNQLQSLAHMITLLNG